MLDLSNLNLKQLREILSWLRQYQDLKKKVWKRWVDYFKRTLNSENLYVVEYYPSIQEDDAYFIAKDVYKRTFWIDVDKSKIKFCTKDSILWWIKVYRDDSMIDLSFLKIEKLMKK